MNASHETDLKIIVERAVRPIVASSFRKRAIREELLAHVSAAFEEEQARGGDESAALARTAERFGDPAELTAQLQAAVPALDAYNRVGDWLWYQPGEATWQRGLRLMILSEIFSLFLILYWRWNVELTVVPFGTVLLMIAGFVLAVTFLASAVQEILREPSARTWLHFGLVSCASTVVLFGLLSLHELWTGAFNLLDLVIAIPWVMLFTVWMGWCVGQILNFRMTDHAAWADLPLDAGPKAAA